MKTKEILQKTFGVLSSLYLLYVAGIIAYFTYYAIFPVDYISFKSISIYHIVFAVAFFSICVVNAVLLFLKNVLNIKKINNELLTCLLLFLLFVACFVVAESFFPIPRFVNWFILAIIVIINMLLLKQSKSSKGIFMVITSAVFCIFSVINTIEYSGSFIYEILGFQNKLLSVNITPWHILSLIAGVSFLAEAIFVLINVAKKDFNKNAYIWLLSWNIINIALRFIIPEHFIEINKYFIFSAFDLIDTWLIYVNWNLLRYFIYIVFIYFSLDFYKKEKTVEIKQIS